MSTLSHASSKRTTTLSAIALGIAMAFTGSVYAQEYEMPEPPQEEEEEVEGQELSREELAEQQAQQALEENQPTDYSGYSLAAMLEEVPFFAQFHEALEQTGLLEELDPDETYTVFAPFDEAFARVPADVMENWQAGNDEEGYREFVAYHIIEGEITSESLGEDAESFTTLNGDEVEIRSLYGAIMAGTVSVNMPDMETAQGYVHGIDAVLYTPVSEEPEVAEQSEQ